MRARPQVIKLKQSNRIRVKQGEGCVMSSRENGLLALGVIFEIIAVIIMLGDFLGDRTISGSIIFIALGVIFIATSRKTKET